MATVELRFSALPEHVRTARLVAAAVARRAGVDEAVLDEVRLAVGEACSRAVGLHQDRDPDAPVRVVLAERAGAFTIEVGDAVSEDAEDADAAAVSTPGAGAEAKARPVEGDLDGDMGLAVISGLVDDVRIEDGPDGGLIRMSWPARPAEPADADTSSDLGLSVPH
jgi:anti-sigma regulatory factor (Ser/Thr protein kinase)